MLDCNRYRGLSVERHLPCRHLVQGNAHRVNIASLVAEPASCLFRRRIVDGTHSIGADRVGRSRLGNPKIRHFHLAVFGNDDVLRLDISVYNVCRMGDSHTRTHLNRDADDFLVGQPALSLYIIFQRNPLDQLHDHVIQPPVFSDVVYVDNIRMN